MARYRQRDEVDLVWNRIRRRITRELDMEIANRREEVLNILLTSAWDDYVKAIATGDLQEVEMRYSSFVAKVVEDIVPKGFQREMADH